MGKSNLFRYQNILRLIGIVTLIVYLIFLISESQSEYAGTKGELISTYALFILFGTGIYFQWKNELIAGLIWILWYSGLLLLVRFVWIAAGVTIVLGLPILILGILVFFRGWREHR